MKICCANGGLSDDEQNEQNIDGDIEGDIEGDDISFSISNDQSESTICSA